jgi:hypothetical protein
MLTGFWADAFLVAATAAIVGSAIAAPIFWLWLVQRGWREQCDCGARVDHYSAGFVGLSGRPIVYRPDCPKCHGTGRVDPKSPFAEKPSPVRGLPMTAAMLAAAATAKGAAYPGSDFDEAWDEARRREDEMVHHPIGGA